MLKRYFLSILIVTIGQLLFSQTTNFNSFISPPGTNNISDNLYLDKVEVTNLNWLEFIIFLIQTDTTSYYLKMLPDSTINKFDFEIYVDSKELENYPVTGITYEQALAYCNWRSEFVTKTKNRKAIPKGSCAWKYWIKFEKFDPERNYKIVYRLPTPKEYEQFYKLKSKDNYDSIIKPIKFKEKEKYFNFIIGNVSEMTFIKGIAKGMDFKHKPIKDHKKTELNKDIIYQKPELWLGFRCIAEYILIEE